MIVEIKLSPKYGVNPTIPVCFWCGEDRGEVALMGHIGNRKKHEDFQAPMRMVLDYEPCDKCKERMSLGFTIMEATTAPNDVTDIQIQKGVYPTGRYAVITKDAASRIFKDVAPTDESAFVESGLFWKLMQIFD